MCHAVIEEMSGQHHTPGERALVPVEWESGWAPEPLPGMELQIIQPIAQSQY